jgi:hypothetical protein
MTTMLPCTGYCWQKAGKGKMIKQAKRRNGKRVPLPRSLSTREGRKPLLTSSKRENNPQSALYIFL